MENGNREEREHFLRHQEDHGMPCKCRSQRPQRTLLYHIAFFFLYVCFTIVALVAFSLCRTDSLEMNTLTWNNEPLALQRQRFILTEDSPYAGPPSDDIDHAWSELLDHVNIYATDSELDSSNQSSVEFPSRQGSLVWMDVSHQLHCVKYLRQWVYRDHYHPDISAEETDHWLLHVDHCLDLLRQALMCRADTSLMTFHWEDGEKEPMLKLESPEHICVDWDDLMEKVDDRRVSDADMDRLTNPSLGTEG